MLFKTDVKKYKTSAAFLILMVIFMAMASSLALAQSGGDFTITKSTLPSGGGQSSGGDFAVTGSIGQIDASGASIGDDFSLAGGFWHSSEHSDIIFKHGFEQ